MTERGAGRIMTVDKTGCWGGVGAGLYAYGFVSSGIVNCYIQSEDEMVRVINYV